MIVLVISLLLSVCPQPTQGADAAPDLEPLRRLAAPYSALKGYAHDAVITVTDEQGDVAAPIRVSLSFVRETDASTPQLAFDFGPIKGASSGGELRLCNVVAGSYYDQPLSRRLTFREETLGAPGKVSNVIGLKMQESGYQLNGDEQAQRREAGSAVGAFLSTIPLMLAIEGERAPFVVKSAGDDEPHRFLIERLYGDADFPEIRAAVEPRNGLITSLSFSAPVEGKTVRCEWRSTTIIVQAAESAARVAASYQEVKALCATFSETQAAAPQNTQPPTLVPAPKGTTSLFASLAAFLRKD